LERTLAGGRELGMLVRSGAASNWAIIPSENERIASAAA
jgi:hypothetical protein